MVNQSEGAYSNGGGVWGPSVKDNLGALSRVTSIVFKVVNGISAVVFREVSKESIVRSIFGYLRNNNLGLGLVQGENDVFACLLQLQIVESKKSLIVNGNTRSRLIKE